MKTSDLMVGDWVDLNYDMDYKKKIPIYTPVQITAINKDGTVDVDWTLDNSESMKDGWDMTLIKPIPLTDELLKKYGFYSEGRFFSYSYDEEMGHHTSFAMIHCYLTEHTYVVGRPKLVVDGKREIDIFADISYVHELQHTLKLLKIKKEIEL